MKEEIKKFKYFFSIFQKIEKVKRIFYNINRENLEKKAELYFIDKNFATFYACPKIKGENICKNTFKTIQDEIKKIENNRCHLSMFSKTNTFKFKAFCQWKQFFSLEASDGLEKRITCIREVIF